MSTTYGPYGSGVYGYGPYGGAFIPNTVALAATQGWVSWEAWNVGLLSFDHSLLDSADVFGVSPLDATFDGPQDDISNRLDTITITRGRNDNLTTMLAGEATIDIRDPDGTFNPENVNGPLYGQLEDRLHPIKLQSVYNNVIYPRYYGWADLFKWQPSGRRGITQLHCVDLTYWLKRANPTIASTGPTTTGAAIGLILDAIGATDPALRDLDVGDTIPDFTADGSTDGLTLIGNLLDAERGVFFCAANGAATYRSRLSRLTKTSSATFVDTMNAMEPGVDFNQAMTRVTIVRTQTGHKAVWTAPPSIEGKVGYVDVPEIDTPYLNSDSQADALSEWIGAQVSTPRPPMRQFQIDNREPALLEQILARELIDRISVVASRGSIDGDYHIDSLTETIDAQTGAHTAQWLLSRASTLTPIEFDVSSFDNGAEFVY